MPDSGLHCASAYMEQALSTNFKVSHGPRKPQCFLFSHLMQLVHYLLITASWGFGIIIPVSRDLVLLDYTCLIMAFWGCLFIMGIFFDRIISLVWPHVHGHPEIEFLREGSEVEESEFAWQKCTKNPGHKKFIPVTEFNADHLPYPMSDREHQVLKASIDLTVRLRVQRISSNRPVTDSLYEQRGTNMQQVGTGSIGFVYPPVSNQPCPCRDCEGNVSRIYWPITVCTASHVVYDTEEAQETKVDLFFDEENSDLDGGTMKSVWAVKVIESKPDDDLSMMMCITHDEILAKRIDLLTAQRNSLHYPAYPQTHNYSLLDWLNLVLIFCGLYAYTAFVSQSHGNLTKFIRDILRYDMMVKDEEFTQENIQMLDYCLLFKLKQFLTASVCHDYVLVISHPHGKPKRITVDKLKSNTMKTDDGEFAERNVEYCTATCKGSSGAPVLLLGKGARLYPWRATVHNGGCDLLFRQVNYCNNWIHCHNFRDHHQSEMLQKCLLSKNNNHEDHEDPVLVAESETCSVLRTWRNYCRKNPDHKGFMPIQDLFSAPWLVGKEREILQLNVDRTVKISVTYTSLERPDRIAYPEARGSNKRRVGTGYVCDINENNEPCPCCAQNEQLPDERVMTQHWIITVNTAYHVVYNLEEAMCTKVDLFYNNEESESDGSMITLSVFDYLVSDPERDVCTIVCATHDPSVVERLGSLRLLQPIIPNPMEIDLLDSFRKLLTYGLPKYVLIVSHPHGKPKRITIGALRQDESERAVVFLDYHAETCPGCSGAPVLLIDPHSPSRISRTHLPLMCLLRTKVHSSGRFMSYLGQVNRSLI